jgi:shikimate 5-dehydrogenase
MSATAAPAKPSPGVIDSVKEFVAGHGGAATAVLQPMGRIGVRITLVGKDGVLGDRVVGDLATAKALVEHVDGLSETEHWDRELISIVTPAKGHWAKMAGWVARQTRFPAARNER